MVGVEVDVCGVVLVVVEAGDTGEAGEVDVEGTLRSDRWCLVRCPRERRR